MEVLPKSRDSKDIKQYWKIVHNHTCFPLGVPKWCLITLFFNLKTNISLLFCKQLNYTQHILRSALRNFIQVTLVPIRISASNDCCKTSTPSHLLQLWHDLSENKGSVIFATMIHDLEILFSEEVRRIKSSRNFSSLHSY